MDVSLLKDLKEKMLEADDFAEVWDFFLTNFGEDPEFMQLGRRVYDNLLIGAIKAGVREMFERDVKLQHYLLIGLTEHQFIHGGFIVAGLPGTVIYFQDVQVGMISVPFCGPNGETKVARITTMLPPAASDNRKRDRRE